MLPSPAPQCQSGNSALMVASELGRARMLDYLISAGANVNHKNRVRVRTSVVAHTCVAVYRGAGGPAHPMWITFRLWEAILPFGGKVVLEYLRLGRCNGSYVLDG